MGVFQASGTTTIGKNLSRSVSDVLNESSLISHDDLLCLEEIPPIAFVLVQRLLSR